MSVEGLRISNYWTNEPNIKEAKTIFFDKGVIKRELISDQLAFSWLRCKYKNVPHSFETTSLNKSGKRIPSKQVKISALTMSEIWIALIDEKYDIIAYTGSVQMAQMFAGINFSEAVIGTNGVGTCIDSGKVGISIGLEHYSTTLEGYVTIGMPLQNLFVGIVLPLQFADDEALNKVLSYPYETLFQHEIGDRSQYALDLYFFRKDIQVYKTCFQQFNNIVNRIPILSLTVPDSWEGYSLSSLIHEKSVRAEQPFEYICNQDGWRLEGLLSSGSSFSGTIVIENMAWFSQEIQKKTNQFIESKLINSKPYKCLFKSDIAIIFVEICQRELLTELPKMYLGLQSKLSKVNLVIPAFGDVGQQFKSYLYTEFEKICAERYNRQMALSEEALNLLTGYKWVRQYAELLYIADYVIDQDSENTLVPVTALPDYILRAVSNSGERKKLKEHEKELIVQLLKTQNGNIKKTSEVLGITRTTLYKKIAEYGIDTK